MKMLGIFMLAWGIIMCPQLACGQTRAAVVRLPQHHVFPMRDTAGKVLWTRITNNSDFQDTLYPLYHGKPGTENKYRNDQALIKWLMAQVPETIFKSNDTDKIKLALIYAAAPLTKGTTKLATTNFFNENKCDNPDSAFARKYSIIGSLLGVFHDHCGDQVRLQQEILVATGYFKYTDFLSSTLGWHTTGAILYKGDTIAVDYASNKPFFLIKNPAKASGFASPQDLHDDTLLITADQVYTYTDDFGNQVNREVKADVVSLYRQTYAYKVPRLKNVAYTGDTTYKIENMWIMPPHSSILWADTFYYVIDSTGSANINNIINDANNKEAYYAEMRIMTKDPAYADSVNQTSIKAVAKITGTDFNTARDIYLNDKLALYNASTGWRPAKTMSVPRFHVSLTSDIDYIVFGRDAYYGGGFVTAQHLKNKDTDTQLNYGLWGGSIMKVPVIASYKEAIYAIGPEIFVPPASTLNMDISYNPAIIDFYNGPSFWVSDPKALLIESSADTGNIHK